MSGGVDGAGGVRFQRLIARPSPPFYASGWEGLLCRRVSATALGSFAVPRLIARPSSPRCAGDGTTRTSLSGQRRPRRWGLLRSETDRAAVIAALCGAGKDRTQCPV